ncbi:LPXTG cell wall anchor domain-containing protein [Levilactobacillus namurensis]|uniref:LPXTG cell wall anchor domain-containing protein n=1 Tax=Levilactobacillus namurensis TaxID=380393 RepID=A0AAW8W5E5_9LACO|nr:LPXTG cell wall anchor domain-containing protein [Levilactobacillus namurensis]MDT7013760.1 LPXTG cell wall anchor domain-containing protein [Levilactobacillus namurensis]
MERVKVQGIKKLVLMLVIGMSALLLSPPVVGWAKEIPATGLDANSAVIKDAQGNVISHTTPLPESLSYTVSYNWRVASFLKISPGDTMTVYLPENVAMPEDTSFSMVNTSLFDHRTIGTFFMAKGARTGTVTLNATFASTSYNRKGYIRLDVTGREPDKENTLEAPINPTPENPDDSETVDPEAPEDSEPEQPSTTEPEAPEDSEPEQPSPTEPVTPTPEHPSTDGTPTMNDEEPVNTPAPEKPEVPSSPQPGTTTPELPGDAGGGGGSTQPTPSNDFQAENPSLTPVPTFGPQKPESQKPESQKPVSQVPSGSTTSSTMGQSTPTPGSGSVGNQPVTGGLAHGGTASQGTSGGMAQVLGIQSTSDHPTATLPQTGERPAPLIALSGCLMLFGLGCYILRRHN